MSDQPQDPNETPTTETTPQSGGAAPAAPAAAPAPKLLTEEQVNEIVQRRLAEDRARRERQVQQQPPPAAKPVPATPADEVAALKAKLDEMEQRSAFDKRVGKYGLTEARSESLFTLYKAQKPENPSEWVEATVKEFGWTMPTQQPSTPAPAATSTPTETPKPAPAAPNAPVPHALPTNGGLVDLWHLTPAQLEQMGPAGVRAELERHWDVGHRMSGAPTRPKPPKG